MRRTVKGTLAALVLAVAFARPVSTRAPWQMLAPPAGIEPATLGLEVGSEPFGQGLEVRKRPFCLRFRPVRSGTSHPTSAGFLEEMLDGSAHSCFAKRPQWFNVEELPKSWRRPCLARPRPLGRSSEACEAARTTYSDWRVLGLPSARARGRGLSARTLPADVRPQRASVVPSGGGGRAGVRLHRQGQRGAGWLGEVEGVSEVAELGGVLSDSWSRVGSPVGGGIEPGTAEEVVLDELEVGIVAENLVVD